MLSKIINLKDIKIIKDDFIDLNLSLNKQRDSLYEDMFSAQLERLNLNLDIGWYGDFKNGNFIIFLIKNSDWDEPIIKIKTRNTKELINNLEAILCFIEKLNSYNNVDL